MEQERQHGKDDANDGKDLRDVSGIGSDTAKPEDRRDDGDDKEDNCPLQHKIPFQE